MIIVYLYSDDRKWDSMNKSKNKYEQIMMIWKWDSMNKSKNRY